MTEKTIKLKIDPEMISPSTRDAVKKAFQDFTKRDDIDTSLSNIELLDDAMEGESFGSIKHEHKEIHEGSHFFISDFETLGTDATADFAVDIPDSGIELHMTFEIFGQSRTEVLIFEGSNVDSDGTTLTAQNNKRGSSNTSVATIQKNPTVNSTGTQIAGSSKGDEGTGFFGTDVAGPHERGSEIILKPNETYIFRIISRDSSNIISYKGQWYEESV